MTRDEAATKLQELLRISKQDLDIIQRLTTSLRGNSMFHNSLDSQIQVITERSADVMKRYDEIQQIFLENPFDLPKDIPVKTQEQIAADKLAQEEIDNGKYPGRVEVSSGEIRRGETREVGGQTSRAAIERGTGNEKLNPQVPVGSAEEQKQRQEQAEKDKQAQQNAANKVNTDINKDPGRQPINEPAFDLSKFQDK